MDVVGGLPLIDYYKWFTTKFRGTFGLLILALVRDADAPSFYSDLQRYWNSLHDVTGDHAVFAVAGANAAGAFQQASVLELPQNSKRFSSDILVTGRNTPSWEVPMQNVRQEWQLSTVVPANTSQVSDLRRFLDLAEKMYHVCILHC